ncbi:DeoR/GlpR family DNA-binding transcription regulator [Bacillus sp. JCM 19034]|uniref:DeoR/GlpR family DNA-binding transcription regulator n=1 Tax=Bacillus sp. JCM 19034 TaxID=1481928 RepID=UPI0007838998|nr:DeoR/GlpR family DNA-binding transcription regulator [Bacillus sp. JCM 19034]
MLVVERQKKIVSMLHEMETVKIQDIIEVTGSSESTVRRDLMELERAGKLKRLHGGATLPQNKLVEPTMEEKTAKNRHEKRQIAKFAAELVTEGDCIYLDAGTSTLEMIPFLKGKDVVVVTNGLMNIAALLEIGINTHVIGGYVKSGTSAFIGRSAIRSLETYQFDKAFIGVNGISLKGECTTPDPEEAFIKEYAIERAQQGIILADHTKFGEVSFSTFAQIRDCMIVTSNQIDKSYYEELKGQTTLEVVSL